MENQMELHRQRQQERQVFLELYLFRREQNDKFQQQLLNKLRYLPKDQLIAALLDTAQNPMGDRSHRLWMDLLHLWKLSPNYNQQMLLSWNGLRNQASLQVMELMLKNGQRILISATLSTKDSSNG